MLQIVIPGQTPAQKNGKSIGRKKNGGMFMTSNKNVKDWQKATVAYLAEHAKRWRPEERMVINYWFYVKNANQRDTDNMITSINDVLQQALSDRKIVVDKKGKLKEKLVKGTGLITGDHWQVLKIGLSDVAIDKENPRAVLELYSLSEWHDFYGIPYGLEV